MDKVMFILRKDFQDENYNFSSKVFSIDVQYEVIKALQIIKNEKPFILVIDMATSKISGIDLVKIIRSNPSNYHMKIIITSKNFNYKYIRQAFALGVDYYLKFPFQIEELEKIYQGIKLLNNYVNLESIARNNKFNWTIG